MSGGLAVAALLVYGGLLLMTYPSLHTFVGTTVRPEEQTRAFSWVSNIQILSGALVSLVSGFLSDALGIHVPFIFTAVLTLAIFLFYLPRGPEFFGGRKKGGRAGDGQHRRSISALLRGGFFIRMSPNEEKP